MLGGGGIAEQDGSAVSGGGGIAEQEASAVLGGGGTAERSSAVLGGGGIAEQDGSAVSGGGGTAERSSAVLGGGGIAEHEASAVLGGGGMTDPDSEVRGGGGIAEQLSTAPGGGEMNDSERARLSAPVRMYCTASVNVSPSSSPGSPAALATNSIPPWCAAHPVSGTPPPRQAPASRTPPPLPRLRSRPGFHGLRQMSEVQMTTRVRSPRNRSRANSSGSPERA
jgi:hypothetical protein